MVKALRNKNPTPVPTRILLIDAGSSSRLKNRIEKNDKVYTTDNLSVGGALIPLLRPSPAEIKKNIHKIPCNALRTAITVKTVLRFIMKFIFEPFDWGWHSTKLARC